MTLRKLPNGRLIYLMAIFSCIFFILGGAAIVLALSSFFLAKKSENIYQENPESYSNLSQIKKGKVIAIFGIILNLMIVAVTIWTLTTIGWDAWSDEFVRKWNEGLESGRP